MKIRYILTVAIVMGLQLSVFAGGPWANGKGKAYVKLSEWWTVFDEHYTDQGRRDPNVTTGIFNTSLYVEYGLSDKFTATFNGALFSRNFMNNIRSSTTDEIIIPGEALNSIGDIDVGLKYSFNSKAKIPVSLTVILGLPLGTSGAGDLGNLQTGDGEFNQTFQIDAGTGFQLGKCQAYVSGYAGVNNRTQGFSEEFRYGLEFGLGLFNNKFWLSGKLNAVESFRNGDTAGSVTSTSIFANNSEFLTLGLEANYYVTDKFGISAGFASAVSGEIIAAAPSYSVGVFLDLK